MTRQTRIDLAFEAMSADGDSQTHRMAFFEAVADAELIILLKEQALEMVLNLENLESAGKTFAVVFDTDGRLAEYASATAHYAALPGRKLVKMLAGQGVGIALNPGVAPSSYLIAPQAVEWLASVVREEPEGVEQRIISVGPPASSTSALVTALDRKFSSFEGMAKQAVLASVVYLNGEHGNIVAFVDPIRDAETALAQAVYDVLKFNSASGNWSVGHFASSSSISTMLTKKGLVFDLPKAREPKSRSAPGSDPDNPPRLR